MMFLTKFSSPMPKPKLLVRSKHLIKQRLHLFPNPTSPAPPALTITVLWPKAELPPNEAYISHEHDTIPAHIHSLFDSNLSSVLKFSPDSTDIGIAANFVFYILIDAFLAFPEHFLTPCRKEIRGVLEGDEGAGVRELLMVCCTEGSYARIRQLST